MQPKRHGERRFEAPRTAEERAVRWAALQAVMRDRARATKRHAARTMTPSDWRMVSQRARARAGRRQTTA